MQSMRNIPLLRIVVGLGITAGLWQTPGHAAESVTRIAQSRLQPLSDKIDQLIQKDLRANRKVFNDRLTDEQFARRAYLDVAGRIPTYSELEEFLGDRTTSRRAKLIDKLLDSRAYDSHMFNFWADLLRVKTRLQGFQGLPAGMPYIEYIRDSIEKNTPYDEFVHELISAEGSLWQKNNGAVGYYLRDRGMELDNMANTVQVFLGTQLQCAQCHDHPFDKWTQKQFYEMAAFTSGQNNFRMNMHQDSVSAVRKEFNPRSGDRTTQSIQRFTQYMLGAGIDNGGSGMIMLPKDYQYKNGKPGEVVEAKVMFGNNPDLQVNSAAATGKNKSKALKQDNNSREAVADWITSRTMSDSRRSSPIASGRD